MGNESLILQTYAHLIVGEGRTVEDQKIQMGLTSV